MAPPRDRQACELLRRRRLSEAAIAFRRLLARDPTDLVAYLGLLQAEPKRVHEAIRGARTNTWSGRMKLGMALLVKWTTVQDPRADQILTLARAYRILENCWEDHPTVFGGMLLRDVWHTVPRRISLDRVTDVTLRQLVEPRAYARYDSARRAGWRATPPPVDLVPPASRIALRELLLLVWVEANTQTAIHVKTPTGVRADPIPIPPVRKAKGRYFAAWRANVERVLPPGWYEQ